MIQLPVQVERQARDIGINTKKYHVFAPMRRFQVTSTPTRPVNNVVISTKGLQDRNTNIIAGTTVENKGKLILIEI